MLGEKLPAKFEFPFQYLRNVPMSQSVKIFEMRKSVARKYLKQHQIKTHQLHKHAFAAEIWAVTEYILKKWKNFPIDHLNLNTYTKVLQWQIATTINWKIQAAFWKSYMLELYFLIINSKTFTLFKSGFHMLKSKSRLHESHWSSFFFFFAVITIEK